MLSRRSVRVKVMQFLYAMDRDVDLNATVVTKRYAERINISFELLLFNIYILREITRLSIDDKRKRKAKHLPTDLDKIFTTKLFKNDVIQFLVNNNYLNSKVDKFGFADKLDKDYFKKLYTEFAATEPYAVFIRQEESNIENSVEILLELFRFCRQSEFYNDVIEDHYSAWIDDKSLVIGATKKILKSLPSLDRDVLSTYFPDDETVNEYGAELLARTIQEKELLIEIIKPMLKNWDHERLAVIDTILLNMAVCEFLFFESIPTKVTLNEYVDISKEYSTPKSKEFINGVLDQVLKKLDTEGKIKKKGRGLIQ